MQNSSTLAAINIFSMLPHKSHKKSFLLLRHLLAVSLIQRNTKVYLLLSTWKFKTFNTSHNVINHTQKPLNEFRNCVNSRKWMRQSMTLDIRVRWCLHNNNKYPINKVVFVFLKCTAQWRESHWKRKPSRWWHTKYGKWNLHPLCGTFFHTFAFYTCVCVCICALFFHLRVSMSNSSFWFSKRSLFSFCSFKVGGFCFIFDMCCWYSSLYIPATFLCAHVYLCNRWGCLLAFMKFSLFYHKTFRSNLKWCWYGFPYQIWLNGVHTHRQMHPPFCHCIFWN